MLHEGVSNAFMRRCDFASVISHNVYFMRHNQELRAHAA